MAKQVVGVRSATVEIRTVNLTKALLKQFRSINSSTVREHDLWDDVKHELKADCVLGWFAGGIINDNECMLLTNNKGDYFIQQHGYVRDELKKQYPQIYITS